MEASKAWSQNLGHEHINTTLTSYGTVSSYRQGEILNSLARGSERSDKLSDSEKLVRMERMLEQLTARQ